MNVPTEIRKRSSRAYARHTMSNWWCVSVRLRTICSRSQIQIWLTDKPCGPLADASIWPHRCIQWFRCAEPFHLKQPTKTHLYRNMSSRQAHVLAIVPLLPPVRDSVTVCQYIYQISALDNFDGQSGTFPTLDRNILTYLLKYVVAQTRQ